MVIHFHFVWLGADQLMFEYKRHCFGLRSISVENNFGDWLSNVHRAIFCIRILNCSSCDVHGPSKCFCEKMVEFSETK